MNTSSLQPTRSTLVGLVAALCLSAVVAVGQAGPAPQARTTAAHTRHAGHSTPGSGCRAARESDRCLATLL